MESSEKQGINFDGGEIVGFFIHDLSKKMNTYIQNQAADDGDDLRAVSHGWLIGYLWHNRDHEIYQRDLEDKLHLAKSSIATMLQTLENAGYIRRETPPHDARQKLVVLTEEGCEFEQRMRRRILAAETQVRTDLSDKDMEDFFRIMRKMLDNMSGD